MGRSRKRERGVFGPRKLKDGRKAYDVRFRNEKGENKSETRHSLEEANELASDIRYGRNNDALVPDTTLGEFGATPEITRTIRREHRLGAKTIGRWESMWRNHVMHADYGIAGKSLMELSKKAPFNAFIEGMDESGVGEPTQSRTLGIVSAFLDEAVEQDLMPRNPLRVMKNKPSAERKRELYIPSIELVERIRMQMFNHANPLRNESYGRRDAMIISLMAYEAPRPEEVRGLLVESPDFKKELLKIVADKAKRGKSKTLIRHAPLNPVVADELQDWVDFLVFPPGFYPLLPLPEWGKRRGGEAWKDENWKDWRNRTFRPAVRRAAKEVARTTAEYEQICELRPYDLRHLAISLWLASGGKDHEGNWDGSPANPVEVASWAGHEVGTMWENYAHVVPGARHVPIHIQIREVRDNLKKSDLLPVISSR